MSNPNNLPIVGEENSHQSLKQEIMEEGRYALKEGKNKDENPYAEGSTFYKWWEMGWLYIPGNSGPNHPLDN